MNKKKIVVVGGGFAGIELVKRLSCASQFNITLVDLNNYNFFPPLIYQVATGFMEPSAISYPFRKIFRNLKNVRFRLGELQQVVPTENKIILNNGELHYDILVMATGTESNFFGNEHIAKYSLPMKTISDALSLRNMILTRLDRATRTSDRMEKKRLLSFVIAGAGPTGVELSGMYAEMRATIIKKDYPELADSELGEIYLVDGQATVLAPMSQKSQHYTHDKLQELGIVLKLNTLVQDFDGKTVTFSDGSQIETSNLIWAAGVSAKTFIGFAKDSYGKGRRLITNAFNLVNGYDNIYAIGDSALLQGDDNYPDGHPQMAQPALQQGRNLAQNLMRDSSHWQPFSYQDKGALAIIGRNKAVFDSATQRYFLKGRIAWLIWIFIHIMSLVNFKNRLRAFYNWLGYYAFRDQYFRMIIKPTERKDDWKDN